MQIIGYIFLGIYHSFIVIPMFFIIPEAIITTGYLLYWKKGNKKYAKQMVTVSLATFAVSTIITHIYLLVRPVVNILEPYPYIYNPLAFLQILLFCLLPFLPLLVAYQVNKKIYKKKERKLFYFSSAYFVYALLIIFFFIRNTAGMQISPNILSKPLLLPNAVNFTEVFDIINSSLF